VPWDLLPRLMLRESALRTHLLLWVDEFRQANRSSLLARGHRQTSVRPEVAAGSVDLAPVGRGASILAESARVGRAKPEFSDTGAIPAVRPRDFMFFARPCRARNPAAARAASEISASRAPRPSRAC